MEQRIEQIEKFASQCYKDEERYSAFIAGVIWSDNNPSQDSINLSKVWHDASEEPQEDGWILVQFSTDVYDTLALPRDVDVWRDFIEMRNFARWAYISDLLPKGDRK